MAGDGGRLESQTSGVGTVYSHRGTVGGPADALAFGAYHEAEDVLVANADMDLSLLDHHARTFRLRGRRLAGWVARGLLGRGVLVPPSRRRRTHRGHAILMAHSPWDLGLLERIRGLRKSASSISVWIPEVWPSTMSSPLLRYEPFSMVDHFFVGIDEVVDDFRRLAPNADVHVLPAATDVLRFAPTDVHGRRPISVIGIGRRDREQHEALLAWSRRTRSLYLYDTLIQLAVHWRDHRESMASWYQQSHVSMCNYAKHDLPEVIGGLRLAPNRMFEGMAAGAILLGHTPDERHQKQLVGELVVDPLVGLEGELNPLLDRPPDDPVVLAIRRRNVALAHRDHDWGHRWVSVLATLDEPAPERLAARLEELERRAAALAT